MLKFKYVGLKKRQMVLVSLVKVNDRFQSFDYTNWTSQRKAN